MKSCLIIACDNGFGHTRRALLLANKLAKNNWDVHLYAPPVAARKLSKLFGMEKRVHFEAFFTQTNAESYRNGNLCNWIKDLPELDRFDIVVSDNLPEILTYRPDAILTGSFFWHRAIKNVDDSLYESVESLLKKHKPMMIASELFVNSELNKLTNLKTVGLCVPDTKKYDTRKGKDLLIACGKGGEFESEFKSLIQDILNQKQKPPFHTVWVDPQIIPDDLPCWLKPATFNEKMYSSLIASICRPGVGTLTDSLWNEVKVFCSFEQNNEEMLQNSKKIKNKQLGDFFRDPKKAYEAACAYSCDFTEQGKFYQSLKRISFSGIEETVQQIEKVNSLLKN